MQGEGEWESTTTPANLSTGDMSPPEPNTEPAPVTTGEPAQKKKLCQPHTPEAATQSLARLAQKATLVPIKAPTPTTPTSTPLTDTLDMDPPPDTLHVLVAYGTEPKDYNNAVGGNTTKHWIRSMKKEWDLLKNLGTFKLVISSCEWVYKLKTNEVSNVTVFKIQTHPQGFLQKYLVNYTDTFATVAKTNLL